MTGKFDNRINEIFGELVENTSTDSSNTTGLDSAAANIVNKRKNRTIGQKAGGFVKGALDSEKEKTEKEIEDLYTKNQKKTKKVLIPYLKNQGKKLDKLEQDFKNQMSSKE